MSALNGDCGAVTIPVLPRHSRKIVTVGLKLEGDRGSGHPHPSGCVPSPRAAEQRPHFLTHRLASMNMNGLSSAFPIFSSGSVIGSGFRHDISIASATQSLVTKT